MPHLATVQNPPIRSVDRELLLTLRRGPAMTIGELTDALGVTATAVRQRIERLLTAGLIDREKETAGRGRPTFRYALTVLGHQQAGANPSELADAMWREIVALPDPAVRESLVTAIASRLGRQYAASVSQDDSGRPIVDVTARMRALVGVLNDRDIQSDLGVLGDSQLPTLDICTCPYPSLTDISVDRAMCRLEEQMFSEALGSPVQLSSCRLDGDRCCQFTHRPADTSCDSHV